MTTTSGVLTSILFLVMMNQVTPPMSYVSDSYGSQARAWFYGICYSPYTSMGVCRTAAECESDVGIIMQHTNRIRVYSTECPDVMRTLLDKASRGQLTLLLGVWVENSPRDMKELNQLIEYLKEYPNASLDGIVIGNEVRQPVSRGDGYGYVGPLSASSWTGLYGLSCYGSKEQSRDVMDGYGLMWVYSHSLQTVDVFSVEETPNPGVVGVSDAVGVNIHPFFDFTLKPPSDPHAFGVAAAKRFMLKLNDNRKKFPGKRIVVTETGWPTKSDKYAGDSQQGSDLLQFHFVKEFLKVVHADPVPYYFFEFRNADWKRVSGKSPNYSEYNFGLYDVNGRAKMAAG